MRRFGFRRVLIVNAFVSSFFLFFNGAFTAETAHWVITTVLLVGGFFRSLEFTALNAIAFADIDQRDMSRATSFSAVGQQLSQSAGVAIGAAALEAARALRGDEALLATDFAPAFYVVAGVSVMSVFYFWPLPASAGDNLTGRESRADMPSVVAPR